MILGLFAGAFSNILVSCDVRKSPESLVAGLDSVYQATFWVHVSEVDYAQGSISKFIAFAILDEQTQKSKAASKVNEGPRPSG